MEIKVIVPRFFVRSLTNSNDRAKQYFEVVKSDSDAEALIIRKLVLSDNIKLYGRNSLIIKKYKNYYLFEQTFGIKMETLKKVIGVLNIAT